MSRNLAGNIYSQQAGIEDAGEAIPGARISWFQGLGGGRLTGIKDIADERFWRD